MKGEKGFQTPEAIADEAKMEAVAVLWDAVERDRAEWAELRRLLDELHLGLANAGPEAKGRNHFEEATRIVSSLLQGDRVENIRHRTAVRALTEVPA